MEERVFGVEGNVLPGWFDRGRETRDVERQRHGLRVPEDAAVVGFDDEREERSAGGSSVVATEELPQRLGAIQAVG